MRSLYTRLYVLSLHPISRRTAARSSLLGIDPRRLSDRTFRMALRVSCRVSAVRTRRSEMNVPPSKKARLTVATAEEDTFRLGEAFLKKLAYASEVDFVPVGTAPEAGSVTVVTHAAQASMPMAELVDLEKEKARMEKELKKNSAELQKLETKLQNPGFVNKAPEHVVKAEQERAVQLVNLI